MPRPLTSASNRFMVSSGPLPLLIVTNPATVVSLLIHSLLKPHRRRDQRPIRGRTHNPNWQPGKAPVFRFRTNRAENSSKQQFSELTAPNHTFSEFLMTAPMNGTAAPPYQS